MKQLKFDLLDASEREAFTLLCASLNKAGVPYSTQNHGSTVHLTIGDGY